jgi:nucleoside-diphosphate-sugar epimerase
MQVSLVHVDDLVEAIILVAGAAKLGGRVYYVADGRVHTVAELGDALLEACGGGRQIRIPGPLFLLAGLTGEAASWVIRRPVLLGRHKAGEGLQKGWVCDDARVRAELGYRSRISLPEGLASTLMWYRRQGWL